MVDFEVTDLGSTAHPEVGERAPNFERPLVYPEYWEDASLSDLTDDGPVLLVFYTMDGAFPATYVWNELSDRGWADAYDAQLVGLSISTPYEHRRLQDERGIEVPLFSDPANEVAEAYGIDHELDGMAGLSEPRPAVFLLDDERAVEYVWVATEWPEFPPYDEVERRIEERFGE